MESLFPDLPCQDSGMTTTERAETPPMFSPEAWEAGWRKAEAAGLTATFQPIMRPVTMRDVEEIVSAVVNHGFEEMYVEQMISDAEVTRALADPMDSLRESMRNRLAMLVLREQGVMLTLPREITDHPELGLTRIRLIVPVRKIGA